MDGSVVDGQMERPSRGRSMARRDGGEEEEEYDGEEEEEPNESRRHRTRMDK